MRKQLWLTTLAGLLLAMSMAPAADEDSPTARALHLVESLKAKDYKSAAKHFDDTMKKLLPGDALAETWKKVTTQLGEMKTVGRPREEKENGVVVVFVPVEFGKEKFDLRIPFDKEKRISGFTLAPPGGKFAFKPPPYADPKAYREVELTLGEKGDYPLPATLTLPKGKGPFPAVVLVHGSGPHDRDETIGPNKPFRDLAWGLASQGVAALRYVKRTKLHGEKLMKATPKVTLKEETIDDALLAAALLRKQKDIDPARIFVLGHSLGGMVAPRIGVGDKELAGLIVLAGNTRPLEDLVEEQFTYLFSPEGKISQENQKKLDDIKAKVKRVKGDLPEDTKSGDLPLGLPASYWRDMKANEPAKVVARWKKPILVLQGERDYQVTMADYAGWQKALKGRKNATLKSYEALNHLFMEGKGKGKSRPAEYMNAGHVSKEVIDDIAKWVKSVAD